MYDAMREREQRLRRWIVESQQRHQRQFLEETKAWVEELAQIELCKPPQPVLLPDGRAMIYCGPMPKWTPDGLDMSEYDAADARRKQDG